MTDPKRQSGEQISPGALREWAQGQRREGKHGSADLSERAADTIQSLQERCGELERVTADYARTRLSDLEKIAALEGALTNTVSALCSVRKNYEERGLGLWNDVNRFIREGNDLLTPGGNGGEGKKTLPELVSDLARQPVRDGPITPHIGTPKDTAGPQPTEPDRPEGECPHPSHVMRSSDASSFDEICVNCGATDALGSWGKLLEPCPIHGTPQGKENETC